MTSTAMNIVCYTSSALSSFRRYCQIVFQSVYTNLHSHQLLYSCSNTWYCQSFKIQSFLLVCNGLLLCIFLMTNEVSCDYWSFGYLFCEVPVQAFCQFFIGLILYEFVGLCNVFWIETFIDVLQITSLILWCAFLLSSLHELILMKTNLSTFPLKFDFYFVLFQKSLLT